MKRYFAEVKPAFKKLHEKVVLPVRKTKSSAGYDFILPIDIEIKPNEKIFFPTDIKAYMREREVLLIHIRSSWGIKKGIVLSNITGVIDSDYADNPDNDGNIGFSLWNTGDTVFTAKKGEAFAQGIFINYLTCGDTPINERSGGFGSTDKGGE